MSELFHIFAVAKNNRYRKIMHFTKREYSADGANRQLLMDIIVLSKKYPEANIVVLKGDTVLQDIRYNDSPEHKMSHKELLEYIKTTAKTTHCNYRFHEEYYPWVIKLKGAFKHLQLESFLIDPRRAKEFAIEQSIKNPKSSVFIEIYGITRAIIKNGHFKKDFVNPPVHVTQSLHGKKRWYSFNDE